MYHKSQGGEVMTLQEAYDKASNLGNQLSVEHSIQSDKKGGSFDFYTVRVDECFACTSRSFEDCFKSIAKQDPAKAKANKIVELKAKLEALES
jgi:hypothetical protein